MGWTCGRDWVALFAGDGSGLVGDAGPCSWRRSHSRCIHASVAMAVVIAIPTPKGIMGVEVAVHGGDREI
jgi:hypothetical protein